jgi:hypothetical protein
VGEDAIGAQTPLGQPVAKFVGVAVPGVGDHWAAVDPFGAYPVEQLQGDPGLGPVGALRLPGATPAA